MASPSNRHSNYAAFEDPATGLSRIGHLQGDSLQPLSFISGTPVQDLYQVIEAGASNIKPSSATIPLSSVKLLAPISGRDILAVGKNYSEHAKEFNNSGFDSSDKVDIPTHPVIFTKRATSIIADGEEIYLHPEFSKTVDYEGEIGVIIGKSGFRVSEKDAWDYVWGYTIINDVTARERQRDHKQFYIGKSPDTFCPMGPVAVPKEDLPATLRVQTHVNGELRQDSTTKDLIFSIPTLIQTLSEGQTLQPGDVIATGTPAGVGIGRSPPIFLASGDEVSVTVEGLGTLRNKVSSAASVNPTVARIDALSAFKLTNAAKSVQGTVGLTSIDSKPIYYRLIGSGAENVVFVHGLGGTQEYWTPLITALSLAETSSLHLYDFEGHGMSPTHPLNTISIETLAADLAGVFQVANISSSKPATLVAHSMGCFVAIRFALDNPSLVKKLVLLGPPPSPLPEAAIAGSHARAELARTKGMTAIIDEVVAAGTSEHTKNANPVALTATRMSLLGQDPESYAKACSALAGATMALDLESLNSDTLIVTGDEDKVSSPALCEKYVERIPEAKHVVLPQVGHWHIFEDVQGVTEAVRGFL